jgi:small GTP-binding protein
MEDRFNDLEAPTVGATWQLYLHSQHGEKLELQIWDTAGQEAFHSLGPLYYRGALGAVVVYDVTNRLSFSKIGSWIDEFIGIAGSNAVIFIVGNKTDLEAGRVVPEAEGREWSEERNYRFFETSAKTGQNIGTLFEEMCETIVTQKRLLMRGRTTNVAVTPKSQPCC